MNATQKRIFELPILFLILWLDQSFEISFLNTFLYKFGQFQLIPVIIFYLSLTRNWIQLALISTIFAYIASEVSGLDTTTYICAHLWTAFLAKVLVTTFALENRKSFTWLVGSCVLIVKIIIWSIFYFQNKNFSILTFLPEALFSSLISSFAAYWLFPLLVSWDAFFEHSIDHSRDLNPSI